MRKGLLSALIACRNKPSRLARSLPQKIKLCTPHFAARNHFDFVDAWRMKREDTLHAYSVGYLTDDEICPVAFAADADDDSLKHLSSFLFAFDNFDVDPHRFSGPERRNLLLGLLAFKFV